MKVYTRFKVAGVIRRERMQLLAAKRKAFREAPDPDARAALVAMPDDDLDYLADQERAAQDRVIAALAARAARDSDIF